MKKGKRRLCPKGHPKTPDNIYYQNAYNRPGGINELCRICRRERYKRNWRQLRSDEERKSTRMKWNREYTREYRKKYGR